MGRGLNEERLGRLGSQVGGNCFAFAQSIHYPCSFSFSLALRSSLRWLRPDVHIRKYCKGFNVNHLSVRHGQRKEGVR